MGRGMISLEIKTAVALQAVKAATVAVEAKERLVLRQMRRAVSRQIFLKQFDAAERDLRETLVPLFRNQVRSMARRLRGMAGKVVLGLEDKGGPGSGSWNGPGDPRFAWAPDTGGGTGGGGGGSEVAAKSDADLLHDYTRTGRVHAEVNEGLRSGKDMSAHPIVNALDRVFDAEAEPAPPVLYRGLAGWEPSELGLVEGKTFTDPGFVSTSDRKKDAVKFALAGEQKISGEAVGIVFKINTGKVPSLNMGGFSMYDENELLLRRGTTFKVTSVKEGYPGEKLAVVTMSVVKQ